MRLANHMVCSPQIKNAVRTAQALAVNEKTPLSMIHIAKVLEVAETFEKDLKGGTGYEGMSRLMPLLQFSRWIITDHFLLRRRHAKLYLKYNLPNIQTHTAGFYAPIRFLTS